MMWVAKMPMMLRLDQFQKNHPTTFFKQIPRKDHFFGSVLSHTNESSGSISFPFNWFSVFIKLSKGGAGEGWLVCSTLAFSRGCTDFEARNRPFYDLVKESMVAHVDSGKTNLDDFECWLRQFHSERDHWGEKWGFFLERMFFFRRERKDTPGFQRKTTCMKTEMKVADGSL